MRLLYPISEKQDPATEALLRGAVETACHELVEVRKIDSLKLSLIVETIATAILERFKAGERDENSLAEYAIWRALETMQRKVH
jgi:hypothetical protein